ncbi:carboxypeptidase-like regulatory domain-containing protein, partial [Patescibacteria group bacterium]|nr:carboxypeptidase-like regulatory domain-containing protein [Patescibacteria group bacterium]
QTDGTLLLEGLAPGVYAVEVNKQGCENWTGQVVVKVGETARVDAVLIPEASVPATLVVNTYPLWADAWISINDEKQAQTVSGTFQLDPGTYEVKIEGLLHKEARQTVTLNAGEQKTLNFPLEKWDFEGKMSIANGEKEGPIEIGSFRDKKYVLRPIAGVLGYLEVRGNKVYFDNYAGTMAEGNILENGKRIEYYYWSTNNPSIKQKVVILITEN